MVALVIELFAEAGPLADAPGPDPRSVAAPPRSECCRLSATAHSKRSGTISGRIEAPNRLPKRVYSLIVRLEKVVRRVDQADR